MELTNTDDLRAFIINAIHEKWTNINAISKKAGISQSGLQKFLKDNTEISTATLFPLLKVLDKKILLEDIVNDLDKSKFDNIKSEISNRLKKEKLSSILRKKIEHYKSLPEPKEKFSIDFIIKLVEQSYNESFTI